MFPNPRPLLEDPLDQGPQEPPSPASPGPLPIGSYQPGERQLGNATPATVPQPKQGLSPEQLHELIEERMSDDAGIFQRLGMKKAAPQSGTGVHEGLDKDPGGASLAGPDDSARVDRQAEKVWPCLHASICSLEQAELLLRRALESPAAPAAIRGLGAEQASLDSCE